MKIHGTVQHSGTVLGEGLMKLNNNNKVDTSVASAVWNSTAPTSSVFSVGTAGDVNYTTNSAEYIAYLWHDVPTYRNLAHIMAILIPMENTFI